MQDVVRGEGPRPFALDPTLLLPASAIEPRLILNRRRQTITLDGSKLTLSPRSFKVLWLLAEAAQENRRVVTRAEIEKCLWGNRGMDKRATADAIRDLRERMRDGLGGHGDHANLIETRQTKGYLLTLSQAEIRLVS